MACKHTFQALRFGGASFCLRLAKYAGSASYKLTFADRRSILYCRSGREYGRTKFIVRSIDQSAMKRTSLIRLLGLLMIMTLVLSGCTGIRKTDSVLSESEKITEAPVQTPAETATSSAKPTPSEAPAGTAAPTDAPAETTPPYAPASAPTITKSPTGETVDAGGSALFIATSGDATRAIWHFVSPDRSQDIEYTEAAQAFSGLEVINGDSDSLALRNIPESLNGWSVYCRFSNAIGSSDTDRAVITVNAAKAPEQQQASFDYTGTFTEARAQRGTLTITGSPSLYEVSVDWYEGSTEYITTFSGVFSDTGVMSYSNACLTVRFEDGSHELRYTGGTGSLAYVDSGVVGVYWTDDQSEYDEGNFFFAKEQE